MFCFQLQIAWVGQIQLRLVSRMEFVPRRSASNLPARRSVVTSNRDVKSDHTVSVNKTTSLEQSGGAEEEPAKPLCNEGIQLAKLG